MATNVNEIKTRLRSVKAVGRMADMMQLASSSKIKSLKKKVEQHADLMAKIHQIMPQRPIEHRDLIANSNKLLLLIVGVDRGLCGGINSFLMSQIIQIIKQEESSNEIRLIVIGRKSFDSFSRNELLKSMIASSNKAVNLEILTADRTGASIHKWIKNSFTSIEDEKVMVCYVDFRQFGLWKFNTISLDCPKRTLSQLIGGTHQYHKSPKESGDRKTIIELGEGAIITYAILQSYYGEVTARTVAMDEAVKNANKLSSTLWRQYNTIRQNTITTSILEIASALDA